MQCNGQPVPQSTTARNTPRRQEHWGEARTHPYPPRGTQTSSCALDVAQPLLLPWSTRLRPVITTELSSTKSLQLDLQSKHPSSREAAALTKPQPDSAETSTALRCPRDINQKKGRWKWLDLRQTPRLCTCSPNAYCLLKAHQQPGQHVTCSDTDPAPWHMHPPCPALASRQRAGSACPLPGGAQPRAKRAQGQSMNTAVAVNYGRAERAVGANQQPPMEASTQNEEY